jgi:signal transduction histidine kinase
MTANFPRISIEERITELRSRYGVPITEFVILRPGGKHSALFGSSDKVLEDLWWARCESSEEVKSPILKSLKRYKFHNLEAFEQEGFEGEIYVIISEKQNKLFTRNRGYPQVLAFWELATELNVRERNQLSSQSNLFDAISLRQDCEKYISLQKLLDALLQSLGCTIATLWEFHDSIGEHQPAVLTLRAAAGEHHLGNYSSTCLPKGEGLVWRVVGANSPPIACFNKLEEVDLVNRNTFHDYKNKPLSLVRLDTGDGKTLGVVCLVGVEPHILNEKIETLRRFQALIGFAITYNAARTRSKILEDLSSIIPDGDITVSSACEFVVDKIRDLIGSEGTSIFLRKNLNSGDRTLELQSVSIHKSCKPSNETFCFLAGGFKPCYSIDPISLTGLIASTGKSIVVFDVSNHPKNSRTFRETVDRVNGSWIGVPITDSSGVTIGVLRCSGKLTMVGERELPDVFDNFDLYILTYLAEILAKAIDAIRTLENLKAIRKRLELSERIRSHEVAAPLASITANTSFIRRYLDDPGVTSKYRRLNEIITDTETCAFLLKENQIPSDDEFEKGLQYLSIRLIVDELQKFLKRQITSRSRAKVSEDASGGELRFDVQHFISIRVEGAAPKTMINRWLIQRAFYNLGLNAVKYGKSGGNLEIRLCTEKDSNHIRIDFEDDGIGISEGDEELIFKDEGRGKNVVDKYPGEGLGLSVARKILIAHGGRLELTQSLAPTIFSCYLPIRKPKLDGFSDFVHPAIIRFDLPE